MAGSFSFNGVSKSYLKVSSIKRPAWAPIKRNIISIPGVAGGLLDSTDTEVRTITVGIRIDGNDLGDLQKVKEDLSSWLITDNPAQLIFDDEPDRAYNAVVDANFDPDEVLYYGTGSITFVCPDPFKYGLSENDVNGTTNPLTVTVNGNVKVNPTTIVTLSADTTFVAIGNGNDVNMVGTPANVDATTAPAQTRELWDELGSLTGWSASTNVEEGTESGTVATDGYSFYASSFGTGSGWHGPAVKKGLGVSVQDFQIDALVRESGSKGQSGSLEIALLDSNNNFVGKMVLTKRSTSNPANWARIRAGSVANGHDILNTRGAYDSTWANFNGMLRIGRKGNYWWAYACLIDSKGHHNTEAYAGWSDTNHISTNPITQIQVQFWQYGTTPTNSLHIDDLKVYQLNNVSDPVVPIIAGSGDVVEFDHENDIIRINGEDMTKYKALIGEYFQLSPGANTIDAEPAESISNLEVRWYDRWR